MCDNGKCRAPLGEKCGKNDDCVSKNCNLDTKKCYLPKANSVVLNGYCNMESECKTYFTCKSNKCKIKIKEVCGKNDECASNRCGTERKVCVNADANGRGSKCGADPSLSENYLKCLSGFCGGWRGCS